MTDTDMASQIGCSAVVVMPFTGSTAYCAIWANIRKTFFAESPEVAVEALKAWREDHP